MQDWREQFEELVSRGRAAVGDDAVRDALDEVLERLSAGDVRPLTPSVTVLGVASCDAGWVGVLIRTTGQTTLHVGGSLPALVEQVREQEELGCISLADAEQPEASDWLATRPTLAVVEAQRLEGSPNERRERLTVAGATVPAFYRGMGFGEEELLTACEAAVEAARRWL